MCCSLGLASIAKIWNETSASYIDVPPTTGIIPALNGFMVETSGSGSLLIPAASRIHASAMFNAENRNEGIRLVARDLTTGTEQESIIKANANVTAGFDADFDSHFLAGFAPKFYSFAGSEQLSTQTLHSIDKNTLIPFGFTKTASSTFSIELTENSLGTFPSLLLTDKQTGTITDLSQTPAYNFNAYDGDNVNRFTLGFADFTGVKAETANHGIKTYAFGKSLFVTQANPQNGSITLFNVMGQWIGSESLEASSRQEISLNHLAPGVYMVSIRTGKGIVNQKVVVGN